MKEYEVRFVLYHNDGLIIDFDVHDLKVGDVIAPIKNKMCAVKVVGFNDKAPIVNMVDEDELLPLPYLTEKERWIMLGKISPIESSEGIGMIEYDRS